jgi:hypothetical protein
MIKASLSRIGSAILAMGLSTCFTIPLTWEIHEDIRFSAKDCRTQLDKMFEIADAKIH